MVLTESSMFPLGASAPDFHLPDTTGRVVARDDFQGRPLLVMFICNHCPYVRHVSDELRRLGEDFADSPLAIVAISSNDATEYPDDGPQQMAAEVERRGYRFPYLYDESQEVAAAFQAACTPDFFLFDQQHRLVYRGRLDESRPTRIRSGVYDFEDHRPTGRDLRAAIDAMFRGAPPVEPQYPSLGCNIKWKPGREPGASVS